MCKILDNRKKHEKIFILFKIKCIFLSLCIKNIYEKQQFLYTYYNNYYFYIRKNFLSHKYGKECKSNLSIPSTNFK